MTKLACLVSVSILVGACGGGGSKGSTELVCGAQTPISGTLSAAAAVTVPAGAAKDLAGAAIAAQAKTTIPAAPVTIACAADIVPAGYLALGPAVQLGAEGTSSDRPFEITLPYKAARLPAGATTRNIRIVAKRAAGPGATPFFPPVVNLAFDDADAFASRATFRAEELTTYQVVVPEGAGSMTTRHYKYRALAGISMGGGAALSTGIRSGRFDVIGSLGGEPGLDATYFGNMINDYMFGGFCTAADAAAGHGAIGQLCLAQQRTPMADQYEIKSDFEHMLYQEGGGVGLTLRRNLYIKGVRDMSRAYGNPALYNPTNAYLPPGIPDSWLALDAATRCATPVVLHGFHDRRYNPDGMYDVITFCDGGDSSTGLGNGVFDPSLPQTNPYEVALAVDVNGNGVRDSGEPVLVQGNEPYSDTGADGKFDVDEPGYDPVTNPDPAGDDFHWQKNPLGTEKNGTWDQGEAFEDVGLDGVAGTCQVPAAGCYDFGEGDGAWTLNPNLAMNWYNDDAYSNYRALSVDEQRSLSIWADAGIRDFLNSGLCGNAMAGHLSALGAPIRLFDDFPSLAHAPNGDYDFDLVDWRALPRNVYVRYGDPDASDALINMGDGRHVGTAVQAINRFTSMFAWIDAQWPNGDRTPADGKPSDLMSDLTFTGSTGRASPYALSVPPGYDENPTLRYPVVYFMHGYGQQPSDLIAISAIFSNYMGDMTRPEDKRFQKMIIVYVDGRCRPGGEGVPVDPMGDQCEGGTFYTNSPVAGHPQMETDLTELMDYIDANYRTKPAEDVQIVE